MTELNLYEMWAEKNQLEEFADWENTEISEMCYGLLRLAAVPDYMSENLRQAVAQEIVDMIKWSEECFEWIDVPVPARAATTRREFVLKER